MSYPTFFVINYLVIGILLGLYSLYSDMKTESIKKKPYTSFVMFVCALLLWFPLLLIIGLIGVFELFGNKEIYR